MKDLKKVHNDRLLLQFDERESEKDREIDILTGYITQHFNVAGAKLKTIISKEKGNKLDPDSKIRKNIQRCVRNLLPGISPFLPHVRSNRCALACSAGPWRQSCNPFPKTSEACRRRTWTS